MALAFLTATTVGGAAFLMGAAFLTGAAFLAGALRTATLAGLREGARRARVGSFLAGLAIFRAFAAGFLLFFTGGLAAAVAFVAWRGAGRFFRFACVLAGFLSAFFTFLWAMTTLSSDNAFGVAGLTSGQLVTDNRLLSAIPRTHTDSKSKLEIRHRAAQEAPELNG